MLTTLTSWLKKPSVESSTKPARARLSLEGLEHRVVPATHTWTDNGVAGLWSDPNNWSGGVPTTGEASGTIVNIPLNDTTMFQDIPGLVVNQLNFTNNGTATLTLFQSLGVSGDFGVGGLYNVTNAAGTTNTITGLTGKDLQLTSASDPFFQVDGTLKIDTAISGSHNLVLSKGGGVLELLRDNTYTGSTFVNQGVLRLNAPAGGGHAVPDGSPLVAGNGNTNVAEAYVQLAAASQLAASTKITVNTDGVFTQINGASNAIGDIDYKGGTVSVGSGNLSIQNVHAEADLSIAATGGQITLLDGQHTIDVDAGKTMTVNVPIVNAVAGAVGGVIKTGGGELAYHNMVAGSPNSYTGVTEVKDGTLSFNDTAANSAFKGDLVIGDGMGAAGSAVVRLDAISEIPDTANLTIQSDGKLDLNTHNETVGPLFLFGGAQITGTTGLLIFSGDVTVPAASTGTATIAAAVDLGAGTNFTVQDAADTLSTTGVISGAGGLVKYGPGTMVIGGTNANTFTGTTTVFGGTLQLQNDALSKAISKTLFIGGGATVKFGNQGGEIPDDAQITISSGGKFDLNGFSDAVGKLVLDGGFVVTTGTGTLILTDDVTYSSTTTAKGTISGNLSLGGAERTFDVSQGPGANALQIDAVVSNGSLRKKGNGTLVLNGDNTYTGTTTLEAGHLVVNGTQAGSNVTATAGTLSGSGSVALVTGGAATVAPGNSPGTLTTKDFTLGTGHYAAEIQGVGASDQIKVTGAVNLTGGTLDLTVLNPTAIGQTFKIIDNDGTADAVTGTFVGLPQDATFTVAGRTYQIKYNGGDGNDVVLTDVTPNTPPTISDVTDQTDPQGAIPFTVGDAETPVAALQVTAGSSNTTLFPAGSVVVGGSGANRTVTLTPAAGVFGTATITLTVTDTDGGSASDTFVVTVSAPPPATQPDPFAVGGGAGAGPTVQVYNPDGSAKTSFQAFEAAFTGGVRTATADVNHDGTPDTIVGAGPGRVAEVRVFDGITGQQILSNQPFADFQGGVFVAAGDFNGDGFADIVITPDEGGGPRVTIVSGKDGSILSNFFAIDDSNFRGGARAAVGDVNGDGSPDLVVSAGFGGGPRIAVFDGKSLGGTPTKLVNDFFAFEPALRNGAYVAVGDLNGDGKADLIFGGGPGGGPRVLALDSAKALQGDTTGVLANFFAGNVDNRGGVRVVAKNLDNDAKADIVVGDGAGAGSHVTTYLGKDLSTAASSFDAFPGFNGGVFVG